MTIRAVFFDLDDTMCDTSASRFERARLAAERIVREHPHLRAEELSARILETDPVHGWPKGTKPLLQELGIEETGAGCEARGLWFFDGCSHLLCPAPGLVEAVEEMKHLALGVITNGDDAIQRRKFGYLGIEEHFKVFVSSERAGCYKPDSAIFELALKEAGVSAGEALFIGDIPSVDVAGAKAAGMKSVWINPAGRALNEGDPAPDIVISHFDELPTLVRSLR